MVPINNIALGTLPPDRLKNASGLFNLTRNLGGAVGLALINTVLIDRNAFHYARLAENVQWGSAAAQTKLQNMCAKLGDCVVFATLEYSVHLKSGVLAQASIAKGSAAG